MNRLLMFVLVSVLLAAPAVAAETGEGPSAAEETQPGASVDFSLALAIIGISLGCALIIVGAALGIGKIGVAAVESIARQPEVGDTIRMAMLIAAALIEGVTLFALVICLMAVLRLFL